MSYFAKVNQSGFLLLAVEELCKVQCYKPSVWPGLLVGYGQVGQSVREGDYEINLGCSMCGSLF